MNSEGFQKSFLNYMKKAPQLAATVDESFCLPASCYSFKWKRIPAWTFKWPSTWTFGCKILAEPNVGVQDEGAAIMDLSLKRSKPKSEEWQANAAIDDDYDDSVTERDSTVFRPHLASWEKPMTPIEVDDKVVYRKPLEKIESSSEQASIDPLDACEKRTVINEKRVVHLLFVEDSITIQKMFNLWVKNINQDSSSEYTIEAVVCTWGYEALERYNDMVREGKQPKLILTDINLENFYLKKNRCMCRKGVVTPTGFKKAGIEFVKAIRAQKRKSTTFERIMTWKTEKYTSLYADEKLSSSGDKYNYVGRQNKNYSIFPYTGPIIALTSTPDDVKDGDKELFATKKIELGAEISKTLVVREKLKNKFDLIEIISLCM
ncbi:MAG: hypothetical protein V4544_00760 [Pseudomonadota bacterium]